METKSIDHLIKQIHSKQLHEIHPDDLLKILLRIKTLEIECARVSVHLHRVANTSNWAKRFMKLTGVRFKKVDKETKKHDAVSEM